MELLQTALDEAPEGTERVITLPKNNRHPRMDKTRRAAGLEPWKNAFHVFRGSCASDLAKLVPEHAVAKYFGNPRPWPEHTTCAPMTTCSTASPGALETGAGDLTKTRWKRALQKEKELSGTESLMRHLTRVQSSMTSGITAKQSEEN